MVLEYFDLLIEKSAGVGLPLSVSSLCFARLSILWMGCDILIFDVYRGSSVHDKVKSEAR